MGGSRRVMTRSQARIDQSEQTSEIKEEKSHSSQIEKHSESPLDDEAKMVDILFRNAKLNSQKLQDTRVKKAAKLKSVGPRMKIVDGKMVIDMGDMVRSLHSETPNHEVEVIDENQGRSAGRKKRYSERWTPEETRLFHTALRLFGTDFELICMCLNNRSRKNVKSKYKKENKLSPDKVAYALANRIPLKGEAYTEFLSHLTNSSGV